MTEIFSNEAGFLDERSSSSMMKGVQALCSESDLGFVAFALLQRPKGPEIC